MKDINKDDFESKVINASKPVLVDFYAQWCAPCKMMSPILESIEKECGEKWDFYKCDIENNDDLATMFNVRSIPTIMMFKDGLLQEMIVGSTQKNDVMDLMAIVENE